MHARITSDFSGRVNGFSARGTFAALRRVNLCIVRIPFDLLYAPCPLFRTVFKIQCRDSHRVCVYNFSLKRTGYTRAYTAFSNVIKKNVITVYTNIHKLTYYSTPLGIYRRVHTHTLYRIWYICSSPLYTYNIRAAYFVSTSHHIGVYR